MAQLKKILAGALALCMAGSVLTACGGSDDSGSAGGSTGGGDTAAAGGEDGGDAAAASADFAGFQDGQTGGAQYNIYCWNTEFQGRLGSYYEKGTDKTIEKDADGVITSIDGVQVNWIINTNDDNLYQTKLDEAIAAQSEGGGDSNIDLFLVEADYALKYVNQDITLDVRSELGLTDSDLSEQYKYTQDVMTNDAGQLKGVSWQATPGLFMYNTTIAEDVLGTSDPDEVQAAVADWDKFTETAAKAKEKGYYMVSGFDDTYRCYSNNVSSPWVTDGKISIDPQIEAWVTQTKEYTDNGYNNKTSLWSDEWAAGQKKDGKTFGYFFSTWGIAFTLHDNCGEDGVWKACIGPQSYFWGGTWICGAYGSDNYDITADIMKAMTCNKDVAKAITEGEQDYTNNKAAIQELIDGGYSSDFLGGQNHLALLTDAADKIDLSNKLSAYDQGCNEDFQSAMKEYFLGNTATYEDAVAKFKDKITTKYTALTMD